MTREEAKQALEATRCFERVGDAVVLRELGLIEAVSAYEAACHSDPPSTTSYSAAQLLRSA